MPRFPRHKYLGPGNSVDSGVPIDRDDEIAEQHDWEYETAFTEEDILKADESAIDAFLEDWQKSGNWHSGVSGLALEAKKTFEGVFGVQYPSMSSTGGKHGGKLDYQNAIRELSKQYRQQKQAGIGAAVSWKQFQKLHFGSLLRQQREQRFGRAGGTGDESGESSGHQSESDGSAPKRQRSDSPQPGPSNAVDHHFDSDTDNAMANMDVESMEAVANPSSGGGVKTTGAGGRSGGGHSSSSGSGSGIVGIPRSLKMTPISRTYRKSWIMFSYGVAVNRLDVTGPNYQYVTPLMNVPVDFLPFYMDSAELRAIQEGGRAVATHARCNVRPLGCRMNFQTGASDSKWATSEFVAIGQVAIGLNLAMPGTNNRYTFDNNNQMRVTSIQKLDPAVLGDKLYGGISNSNEKSLGMTCMIPRHWNSYWTPIVASTAGNAFKHTNGSPDFDRHIDRYLVNTCVGQSIVNYSYQIKDGVIFDNYFSDMYNDMQGAHNEFRFQHNVKMGKYTPNIQREGRLLMEFLEDRTNQDTWETRNYFEAKWEQTLENYHGYDPLKGNIKMNAQPQVHVGLTAVPAINPAKDDADFQNTAIYWAIETELDVSIQDRSCYHYGQPHTYHPRFYRQQTKKYHAGLTYGGRPDLSAALYNSNRNAASKPRAERGLPVAANAPHFNKRTSKLFGPRTVDAETGERHTDTRIEYELE